MTEWGRSPSMDKIRPLQSRLNREATRAMDAIADNRVRGAGTAGVGRCHSWSALRPSPRVIVTVLCSLLALAYAVAWWGLIYLWADFIARALMAGLE